MIGAYLIDQLNDAGYLSESIDEIAETLGIDVAEIERVLLAFPGVVDAIVVRREDPKWGEVPVAFVVRRDDSVTEEALVEACRGEIARYKIPKAVRFVEDAELPRSVTGKIKRQDLEARLKQERA